MKRKLFIVSLIAIFFVCIFSLSAPRVLAEELTDQEKVDQEIENIYVPSTAIIDFPVVHVSVYGSVITWESSNQELLNVPQNGGWVQVTRPEEDTVVTLTVTIKNNEASASKKFEVTVIKGNTLTNTYNITYVLNGGTNNDQNPKSYKVGTEPSILAPTNGNIKFLGWYDNEEFEGEAITKLPHGLTGDYKLYAKWEEVKLTSIEVTKNPVLKYTAKEEFDATGIEVYAVYSDGSKELVDSSKLSYSIEGQSENDLTIHGDTKEVIVSFEGVSTKVALESVELLQYNIEGLFTAQSKEYNGKSQEYTLPKLPEGLTAKTSGTAKDAGTTKVKVLFESLDKDYETPDSIEVDLTITKAKLTVKPTDVYVTVGATMPKFTVTFVGLLGDDDESLFGELEVSTNATDTNTLGEYKLTVKEFEAKNYEVTFQEGKLVVQLSTYTIYVPEEQLNVVYNGKNQMFTASVKDGDKVLPITDIVYEYNGKQFSGATDAGTYEVTISYHHETYGDGKLAVKFNIAKYEFDVNTLKFEDKALEYNGQVQNILVEGNLPEGIKVTYSDGAKDVINNKLIVATFEGNENYTFKNGVKTLEAYLTIEPKALDSSMFDAIPEQDYTGKEITPVVNGSYAGVNFDMTLDFTVKYENNINEGQAKVIITAKENTNFKGTVELTFSIGKTPLVKVKDARIELEGKYTGELVSSLVTEATNGSKVDWLSTSTALSIKDGKVTTIQTNEVQVVVVYGLITYADETGQAAEYVKLEFTIPALGGTTPDVPVDPEPDDPEPDDPVDRTFEQLSDASKITDGTVIVIANHEANAYLGSQSGNYRLPASSIDEATVITLVKVQGGYLLQTGENTYLYYTGSSNTVSEGDVTDNKATWTITYDSEEKVFVITNVANTERNLQYNANKGQERFACYTSNQKKLTIFADPETLGEGTTEPEEPVEPTISSITYVLDGGTLSDGAPTEYEEGKGVATLPTATKEGYEFKGWTLNGQAVTSISATQTGNVELTAVWEEVTTEPDPEEPVNEFPYENTDYNLIINQTNLNKTLYFNGLMDGYYAATSESYVTAVVVNVNKVEGGFNLYVKSTNKYINIVVNGTYNNFKYEDTPSTVWSYDKENNALVATVNNVQLFLGTKDSYATGGIYAISNVTTENHYVAYLAPAKEVSEADKVAVVKDSLTLPTTTTTDLTLPTTGEYNALISWSSNNENAITSAGKVTQGTEDVTVVLTATIKLGNSEDTKELTITVPKVVVVDPDAPTNEVEATLTFDDVSKRTVYTTSQQVWTENGITVTNNKSSSTTNVGNYSNPARFYKGSSITIKAPGKITKIVITASGESKYCTPWEESIKSVTGATVVVNDKDYIVTFSTPVEEFVISATTAQVRAASITVTYISGSTSEEPDEPVVPEKEYEIQYNGVEGATHENPTTYKEEDLPFDLKDASKEGYNFLGWFDGETQITKIEEVSETKLVLEARWEEVESTDPEEPVNPDAPTQEVTSTITFDANKTNRTEHTTEKQVWAVEGLTFTNEKASSTNNVGDYTNPVRLYAGSSIKIECSQMTKIVFTCGSASYATALGNSIGDAATVDGSIVTVDFAEAVDSFDIAKLTAQVRVNSITVTHKTN